MPDTECPICKRHVIWQVDDRKYCEVSDPRKPKQAVCSGCLKLANYCICDPAS